MIKLLKKYLIPYLPFVLLGMVVLLGQAIAELALPNFMSDIVNKGMVQGDTAIISQIGLKMLGVTLISTVCAILASYFSSMLALGIGKDVRRAVFAKVENFSLHEFESIGTSSLITRTTNDVVQIQQVIIMGFRFVIYSPILASGAVIMALQKDKPLSVIFVIAVPLLLAIMVGIAVSIIPSFTVMQKRVDKLNLTLRESLTGIRVIRAFNKMGYEKTRFKDANTNLMNVSIDVNKTMAFMMPVLMLIMNVTTVSIIWFGGIRISKGQMDIGNMMAFIQYAMQIISSVIMVAVMFVMIPRAQASAIRVNEVLEMNNEVVDPLTPQKPTGTRGKIEFRDVSFKYAGSEMPVLSHVSFTSLAGETTAIIGGTGSGKSTIVNLIPRFYDVTDGGVFIDDVDVREMSQANAREKIGFVPQGAILFSGTINENMRFGKRDATDEEIEHAIKIAQAYDFVQNMPDGYETQIAQGGTNVSGGQKQRLSIARAIICKPEIYIFDDSFSALDFKTDAALREALKDETKDATVLIVAQRVTSIIDSDRIIVLDKGEIVGIGTHKELLKNCEVYHEICISQLSEEELA